MPDHRALHHYAGLNCSVVSGRAPPTCQSWEVATALTMFLSAVRAVARQVSV